MGREGEKYQDGQPVPGAADLISRTGRGVQARVNGDMVLIGKAEMFGRDGFAPLSAETAQTIERLREQGRTTMVVRLGDRDLGAIGLMDTPRAASKDAIARLRALGTQRMIMMSGDNQRVATAVAADVGIDEAWGDLIPEDTVEADRKLSAQTPVAEGGDGDNDAPRTANGTVGTATGDAA